MAELNDKLITYGNLSTFYDKLQEQGLGGNAIEEVSELPNASENKDKLFRLSSDDNVYVSELKSRTSTTTNRLPDAQQVGKAYLYETGELPYYYKGSFKVIFSDTEIDGYGWLEDGESQYFILTEDNAENIQSDSVAYGFLTSYDDTIDLVNKIITTDKVSTEYKFTLDSVDGTPEIPIPATYNAPESAQIGNATLDEVENVITFIYDGSTATITIDGEQFTGYKWLSEDAPGGYLLTNKQASNIYYYYDEDNDVIYSDVKCYLYVDGAATETSFDYLYIPQLNAPDSEQVDNAYLVNDYIGGINCVYTGEEETINVSGNTLTAYKWENSAYNEVITYSSKRANEIYNTDRDSDAVHFYIDEGDGECLEATFENSDLTSISTVKYQRTEVTEVWDWQPLTDNATNDDIDAMFESSSPVVKRVLMKDSEDYGYSINEGWINFNDETMSYDGGTYYKWGKYSENRAGEAVRDVDYYILTNTLNPTLPFDVNSDECVYCFEIESDGVTYRIESNETYSKEALIHEDGSITYEE